MRKRRKDFKKIFVEVDYIVTTNTAYGQRGRIRFLNKRGKSFKKSILRDLREKHAEEREKFLLSHNSTPEQKIVVINYYLIDNWITKAGKIKKLDINPRIKLVEDVFFEWLGLDDSIVFMSEQRKLQSKDLKGIIYEYKLMTLSDYLSEQVKF